MKKILLLVTLTALSFASSLDVAKRNISTVCVYGYLFVISTNGYGGGVGIAQIFQKATLKSNPPQPIKCTGTK